MSSIVIIQARMGSNRLPGKSLMEIGGKPMLDYLVETLLFHFPKEDIVLATSTNTENDPLRLYAKQKEIHCFSGDENNVASRYYEILQTNKDKDFFYRICGDSPYYDSEVIIKGKELLEKGNLDLVSSMPNKGYPMGSNLEAMRVKSFLEHYPQFNNAPHFEHVMPYFYENIHLFKSALIHTDYPSFSYNNYKFSVDTLEDFRRAQIILKEMDYCPWNYTFEQKLKLQENNP